VKKNKNINMPSDDWSFDKRGYFIINLFVGSIIFYLVPLNFAHFTETLLLLETHWLLLYSIIHGLVFAVFLEVFGRYEIDAILQKASHFIFILSAASFSAIFLILIVWLFHYSFIGRYVVLYVVFGSSGVSFALFVVLSKIDTTKKTQVLLLVPSLHSKKIRSRAKELKIPFNWIQIEQSNGFKNLESSLENSRIDIVVTDELSNLSEKDVILLLSRGTKISPIELFWCESFRSLPSEYVHMDWLMGLDLHLRNPFNKRIKRLLDLIIASLGLIILSPLLLLAAFAIALESGFPIIFSQTRTGYGGYPYKVYKLRTMTHKAENDGPKWATKKDARVTKVGQLLRNWRIDEIPQFWNILKGEMSIVGPRPERPEFDEILSDEIPQWRYRYLVKPGLTGWAQIRSQYASDEESSREKLAHDLYYIKHDSFFFDMEIILSTIRSLNKGSR